MLDLGTSDKGASAVLETLCALNIIKCVRKCTHMHTRVRAQGCIRTCILGWSKRTDLAVLRTSDLNATSTSTASTEAGGQFHRKDNFQLFGGEMNPWVVWGVIFSLGSGQKDDAADVSETPTERHCKEAYGQC